MAAAAARTMFEWIGFSKEAAVVLVYQQNLQELDDIRDLTDDEVESICKKIARPGGLIDDPNPGAAAGAQIPNPGVVVSV